MNEPINSLKEKYRLQAEAHGKATLDGNYKLANRSHDKLVALVPKIREHGTEGETALLALTLDQDDAVACWAATHCLPFNEKEALAVLNKLSCRMGPMGFNAKMVVQQWKKGQLVLP